MAKICLFAFLIYNQIHVQPAKLYKLKHLSKVEVIANDPSGCTFTLVMFSYPKNAPSYVFIYFYLVNVKLVFMV